MKKEIFVVLDNIRSRENVGSIFRTSDAAGVSKIYLCGITPTPKNNYELRIKNRESDKIAKTALGAEKWVPWEYHKQTWRLLNELRADGLLLVALEQTKKSIDVFKLKSIGHKPLALIVGNEVKGLSQKILKYTDKKIAIRMYGKKESLNVSVAFGVAIYQILRSYIV